MSVSSMTLVFVEINLILFYLILSYLILLLKVVQLEIGDFDIEFHPDCDFDSVKFIDGVTGITLGKLCGDNPYPTPTYMSSSNRMVVRFVSDSSTQHRGFAANFYSLDNSGKSETFHKSESFFSVLFPDLPLRFLRLYPFMFSLSSVSEAVCSSDGLTVEINGGIIAPPGFPGNFQSTCDTYTWKITPRNMVRAMIRIFD